jgi:hypothetical protein
MLTPGIDQQPKFARIIMERGIDAVDPILHGRIGAGYSEAGVITVRITAEEVLRKVGKPLRSRGTKGELVWEACSLAAW